MITTLRKTAIVPRGGPGAAGFVCDKQGRIVATTKIDGKTQTVVPQVGKAPVEKTTSYTVVLPDDDGKVFYANAATSLIFTLPNITLDNAGMRVTVVLKQLPSGVGLALSPHSSDTIKFGTADKDLVDVIATDALGDFVTVQSDGISNWVVVAQAGVWSKEA